MHGVLLPFCHDGILLGIPTDLLRGSVAALCQQVAQALTPADHIHHFDQGFTVAKPQLNPTGVFDGQQLIFKTLHCKGNGHASTDGIQRMRIAQLISFGDRRNIIHSAR